LWTSPAPRGDASKLGDEFGIHAIDGEAVRQGPVLGGCLS
jgi:hypothetical protein